MKGAIIGRIHRNIRFEQAIESRKSYGITMSELFSKYIHDEKDVYTCPFDGQLKARHQIVWLIKKGDLIFYSKPTVSTFEFCRRFSIEDPKVFEISVVECDGSVDGSIIEGKYKKFDDIAAGSGTVHIRQSVRLIQIYRA